MHSDTSLRNRLSLRQQYQATCEVNLWPKISPWEHIVMNIPDFSLKIYGMTQSVAPESWSHVPDFNQQSLPYDSSNISNASLNLKPQNLSLLNTWKSEIIVLKAYVTSFFPRSTCKSRFQRIFIKLCCIILFLNQ